MQKIFYNQYRIALFFFVISAIYGWSMRLYKVVDFIKIPYHSILQAHSHVTFLGWGFLAVISLIGVAFYPKTLETSKYLKVVFGIMSFSLLGLLISFPLQGYKVFSIVFLSSFLIASYFYLARILIYIKGNLKISTHFIRTGIWYYYLSSIGIWAIAFIVTNFGKTDLYFNAIYFYLHFLYNGFFTFSLFGLLFSYMERKSIFELEKSVKIFYWLINLACIPAYTLSLLWKEVPSFVVYIAVISATVQLVSLLYLAKFLPVFIKVLKSKTSKWLAYLIFASYSLKIIIQFLSAFPVIVKEAVAFKAYFIIGYIHLFTLGFMSLFILLLSFIFTKVRVNTTGVKLFVLGIVLSEFLLFFQGTILSLFQYGIENIDLGLLIVSSLLPFGLIVQLVSIKNKV